MAKKKVVEAPAAPKVSKLPLPSTDSALVIDLPDGQKIVIGKMATGSVIEVATWRGVGRPDSRTSRLMLGVGNGNVNEDPKEEGQPQEQKLVKPEGAAVVFYYLKVAEKFVRDFLKSPAVSKFIKSISFKLPKIKLKKKKGGGFAKADPAIATPISSPTSTNPSNQSNPVAEKASSSSGDESIDAWLERITQKASKSAEQKRLKESGNIATSSKKSPKKGSKPAGKKK